MMDCVSIKIVWIQNHNGHIKDGEIWLGYIDRQSAQSFTKQLASVLQECYIAPENLRQIAKNNGLTAGEVLRDQYLPDVVMVKYGDFGEILARSALQEKHKGLYFPVLRWRIKTHKNDTVRGIDLLGYCMHDEKPSPNDELVICEVKTRTSNRQDGVKDAYHDIIQKYDVTQIANNLYYSQKKLIEQGQSNEALKLSRFSNPHRQPYTLVLMPCAVYERRFWKDKYLAFLPANSFKEYKAIEKIEVIVITVEELAHWIDEVHWSAIEQAGK